MAVWMISFLPVNGVCSSPVSSRLYFLSPLRLKGKPTDLPDGGKKKPPSPPGETSSTHASDKHTDTDISTKPAVDVPDSSITPPHHCDIKTSRLPTLAEEETSDVKTPDAVAMVREEADGKDDAAEVNIQNIKVPLNSDKQTRDQN